VTINNKVASIIDVREGPGVRVLAISAAA